MSVLGNLIRRGVIRGAARDVEGAGVRAAEKQVVKKTPLAVERRAVERAPLAVRPQPKAAPKPKVLALPPPRPALPEHAAKPKGGQWWADKNILGANTSPEATARKLWKDRMGYSPEELLPNQVPAPAAEELALRDWWQRAVPRYIKSDLGTPEDPLRALAERGGSHMPDMTPERWSRMARSSLMEDPIGGIMFPPPAVPGAMPGAGDELRGATMAAMPWLAKQPVHENVYGISPVMAGEELGFAHVLDEMANAMDPSVGLPPELQLNVGALQRMSFPQAAERVGRINQWRDARRAEAALSAEANPAIALHKEYPENNPRGLRWVELRQPELGENLDSDIDRQLIAQAAAEGRTFAPELLEMSRKERAKSELQKALQYEGDTMGHCVGGYCDDVLQGRSRIFSLRDAKGEPHVTIETAPGSPYTSLSDAQRQDFITQAEQSLRPGSSHNSIMQRANQMMDEWARANAPNDIVQIKGKANRAPVDEYLPFVQDFVKSGQWGNVGDLGNAGLVQLPDGRYITQQQAEEGIAAIPDAGVYDPSAFQYMGPTEWGSIAPHFEGYAIGGRVSADRCFCNHPMAVRR